MTATTIVGIDPGATGAIAMIQPMVEVWDMPATPHDLATLMRTFDANTTRVYVEAGLYTTRKAVYFEHR